MGRKFVDGLGGLFWPQAASFQCYAPVRDWTGTGRRRLRVCACQNGRRGSGVRAHSVRVSDSGTHRDSHQGAADHKRKVLRALPQSGVLRASPEPLLAHSGH